MPVKTRLRGEALGTASPEVIGERQATTTPSGAPPTIATLPESGVGTTTFTANASVNPNGSGLAGAGTKVWFEWGRTTGYGNVTTIQDIGNSSVNVSVSATVASGLIAGTVYHYRPVAQNDYGTSFGIDEALTTSTTPPPGSPPDATTAATTDITKTTSQLNGTVNPGGLATTVAFQWGAVTADPTDTEFPNVTSAEVIPAGISDVDVTSVVLTGLTPGTPYQARLIANNSAGGDTSPNVVTWTTTASQLAPTVVTRTADQIN